jgi:YggT family protein
MFVLGNFFQAAAMVAGYAIDILWWLIIIRALLSWVSPDPYNPIVQFIEKMTEPFLDPARRLIPSHKLGIDISPLLVLLFLYFLKIFLVQSLLGIALRLK